MAPANRAQDTERHQTQSGAVLVPSRRYPSHPSDNRRSSGSPADDQEFRDRRRCVRDRPVGREKPPRGDSPIPSVATALRALHQRDNEERLKNGSRSSANE